MGWPHDPWDTLWDTYIIKSCCFYYSYKCKVITCRVSFLSSFCRHKAVSSVCRPQTWQEQHPAAQTGHPAHHDHEQDVIHRRQVGDNSYLVWILNMCFLNFCIRQKRPASFTAFSFWNKGRHCRLGLIKLSKCGSTGIVESYLSSLILQLLIEFWAMNVSHQSPPVENCEHVIPFLTR